ncbi:MAG TPA: PilZ domain-containing protein [Candidatus Eremiobacteraceae bacterium]|nr:PilZ domain-containing protein [Candidatus Eremiobacteraceae bacterium]
MSDSVTLPGSITGSKQRRSARLQLQLPILIIGNDDEGRVFSERTHTVVVSLHGAGIVSRYSLVAEQELILRAENPERETEVRVVGEIGQQGILHTYGVAFIDDRVDFWHLEFPPAPLWQEEPVALTLECGGCKDLIQLTGGEYEYDICAIHGGLARYCNHCGLLTVWSRSHEVMPFVSELRHDEPQPTPPPSPVTAANPLQEKSSPEFVPLADSMEGIERRARVRAKVNFFACVRSEQFGDDIVSCIDMSRGGVAFRSRHPYQKGDELRLAVPFSPEAKDVPTIFVRGRITNVSELPDLGAWRCGVEFLRS